MIIIDRFEHDWAVLEHRRITFNFPRELLPPEAKPGDVLDFTISIDRRATEKRKNEIANLIQGIFE